MAAFSGNVELLQFLYDTDKSVLCLKDNDGWTAMHRAAARNKVPAMKFLRELGLELEEKNRVEL
jgi:ankyrin repeat protein